jgi:chaperone BCS1
VVRGELASLVSDYVVDLPAANSFSFDISGKSTKDSARREARALLGLGLVEVACPAHVVLDAALRSNTVATGPCGAGCGAAADDADDANAADADNAAAQSILVLNQELGEPMATSCSASIFSEMVLIARGKARLGLLQVFCDHLIELSDRTEPRTFTISRWNIKNQYWQREQRAKARSLSSVVLPEATMEDLIRDVDEFTSEETAAWYSEHGIPYKGSYLFYGVPGAGKTSLIQALAGKYCLNLCYLSPTHPDLTDDSLKNAFVRATPNSIIVLEDVDALFGPRRQNKVEKCPLTFSGLLNALDGVGPGGGAIVVLTSNHRELLDPALLRPGRVDKHVHFGHATSEQRAALFLQFYPKADAALARRFSDNVAAALGDRQLAMAGLQQYFIAQRKSTAELAAAAEAVASVVKELESREEDAREQAKLSSEKEGEEAKAAKDGGGSAAAAPEKKLAAGAGNTDADGVNACGSKQVHVHMY